MNLLHNFREEVREEEEGATEERREVVGGRELGSGGDRGSDSRCGTGLATSSGYDSLVFYRDVTDVQFEQLVS